MVRLVAVEARCELRAVVGFAVALCCLLEAQIAAGAGPAVNGVAGRRRATVGMTIEGGRGQQAPARLSPPVDGELGGAVRRRVVAVVRSPEADGMCRELVTRIVAELMADGVPVAALTCPVGDLATMSLGGCGAVAGVRLSAVVVVQRRDNLRVVEVRTGERALALSDPASGLVPASDRGRIHRLSDVDSSPVPAALAIRTVELLKAMLSEIVDLEPATATELLPPQLSDEEPAAGASKTFERRSVVPAGPRNLTMSVGAAVFGSFSGLGAAYGPTLTVGRRSSDHVMLSLMVAGPLFARDQRISSGHVSVRQEMAVLQAELLGLFWNAVVLRAGVGAGVYHVNVDGQMIVDVVDPNGQPFVAQARGSGGGFAGLLSWSAGMVVNFRSDVGLFLDGRMFVLTPTPVILLNGLEVGRAGNPGIAVSTGVELRF